LIGKQPDLAKSNSLTASPIQSDQTGTSLIQPQAPGAQTQVYENQVTEMTKAQANAILGV